MIGQLPQILCIDVGSQRNIGWASSDGEQGDANTLAAALSRIVACLMKGRPAAIGFEAPIWTPRRADLARLTSRREGIERVLNRPWSAGAGTGALGTALALMPWCLAHIAQAAGPVSTTVDLSLFRANGGLLLWEAFVSGIGKGLASTHASDAALACRAFESRWPDLTSDIPAEPALNHAVSSAIAAGLSIDLREICVPCVVVGVLGS